MTRSGLQNLSPAAFGLVLAVPATLGLLSTPLPSSKLSVVKGEYQSVYEDAFTKGFPLTELSKDAYTAMTLAVFGQANAEVVIGQDNWLFTAEEFRYPNSEFDFATELQTARDVLSNEGIKLVPVIVPDKARIYSDKLPYARGDALEGRYAQALTVLRDLGFTAIDMVDVLKAERANAETFMRTDTHWSPEGAKHVADSLGDFIELGSSEFVTEVTEPVLFEGDLKSFADTGRFERWVGVGDETISVSTTTATGDELSLFGSSEIGVVLVGTSYSAREDFNFAGALKQATSQDVVNLAQEGRGPFAPMRDALANGTITEIYPNYVLWEIPERYINPRRLP